MFFCQDVSSPVNETVSLENFWPLDVGPFPRQVLTGADDCFGSPNDLTLLSELLRCQVPEGAVRAAVIIIVPPRFDDRLSIGERDELMNVQAFIAEAAVERLDDDILHGFPGPNEVELHTSAVRPILQCARLEFGPMIDGDGPWARAVAQCPVERLTHRLS